MLPKTFYTIFVKKIFLFFKKCLHDTTFKIHKQFFVALLEANLCLQNDYNYKL